MRTVHRGRRLAPRPFRALSTLRAPSPPTESSWAGWIAGTNSSLAERKLLRDLRTFYPDSENGTRMREGDSAEKLVVFAANDYLGLSSHPAVRAAASAAAAAHGTGPRSSALVCGYTSQHAALETALAQLKGTEDALLFPTGFAANLAVLGALATSSSTAIFSDELNHASIVDGARLASRGAGAALHIYRHNDLGHLEALLHASAAPRKLIISDSLFSMDGDVADCTGLVALKARHGALLCLDEAHATLVFGQHGGGIAEAQGVGEDVDLHIGTLSKAFGAHGGFVGCSTPMKRLLLSRGRAGIYSTALPLPAVAAARSALTLATPELRRQLWARVEAFSRIAGVPAASPIVPIIIGSEADALDAAEAVRGDGFLVPAIRPPTVPAGTARLRVALSAEHELKDVEALAERVRALRPDGDETR